ncbi:MAG: aspartate aminotransferase family protein [Bacteroidetes bacterium]|nr:MAG: aspartate aminotransferase family protein [Bacteroidota bacterium]
MLQDDFYRHLARTADEAVDMEITHAEGVWLYGPGDRAWIDFISGICVTNVGHGAPEVVAAVKEQAGRYLHAHVYGEAILSPQVRYATRLAEVLGPGLDHVYFTNSGAEAIEGALKVAKKYTGRSRAVAFHNAYHGSTHGALSLTGNTAMKYGYGPLLPRISHLPFNDIEALSVISDKTAAVFMEVIQGAGGAVLPDPAFLRAVRQRCDETGALLVLDEIQTGFGRTGTLWAHQAYDLRPDILVLAKALGGGLPLGAFIGREEVLSVIRRDPPLGFITTFGGHAMACAAGLAALNKIIEEDLPKRVFGLEAILKQRLQHPAIQELRGRGLLYAALFKDRDMAERVRLACLQGGLLTIGFLSIDHGLRISPPLTMTEEEMHLACDRFLVAVETAS